MYLSPVAASHEDPGAEEELSEPPQLGSAAQLAAERRQQRRRRREERVRRPHLGAQDGRRLRREHGQVQAQQVRISDQERGMYTYVVRTGTVGGSPQKQTKF